MTRKAIVFTHVEMKMEGPQDRYTPNKAHALIQRVLPYFKAYLSCSNVALVYVYVDMGLRTTLDHLQQRLAEEQAVDLDRPLEYTIGELEFEQITRNCLKLAVDQAALELQGEAGASYNRSERPRFQFVGLPHLISLIHSLYRADPQLLQDLAGSSARFTYDSPKFVEAAIRLVRGDEHPILRFDADVTVNHQGVEALLRKATYAMESKLFHYSFFSGGYGTYDQPEDPVNDFAIRLHWLVDRQEYNRAQATGDRKGLEASLPVQSRHFLRDLGEIGATQVAPSEAMSSEMASFVARERGSVSVNRKVQQVISGAGLYMSRTAIEVLPPFMCFRTLTTWVDDHIKRRLHEVLGHLWEEALEHVGTALFRQDRHPEGVPEDSEAARKAREYFDRVFRGCLLHGLVVLPDGKSGPLATALTAVLPPEQGSLDLAALKTQLAEQAKTVATTVLGVWSQADYGSLPFNQWVAERRSGIGDDGQVGVDLSLLVDDLVEDAIHYVQLAAHWHLYVAAIRRLTPPQAYWLFRKL